MTHACYLLRSLKPRFRTRFYIGCTTDPRRRLRQHNGELGQGAHLTKAKRPWEMVLCVYGFSSHVNALKFEWAWQHPLESIAVREAAAKLPSLKGVPGMITLVCTMVTLPQWNSLNLTLQFMLSNLLQYRHGSPPLPSQMRVVVDSMNSLPGKDSQDDNDDSENLSTCPDNEQLDEICSMNASTSNVCGQGVIPKLSSTAELNTSLDRTTSHNRTASPCKTNESDRVQIFVTEEILVGGRSVQRVVHLQQKSLTVAFPVRKQAVVPKSIHRQAGNDEMYKVWDHSNNRKPPEIVAEGKHSGSLHLKSSKGESVQDAVIVIVSDDDDDDELQAVIPELNSTVELYTSHNRTVSPCAKPNESDKVQITVTEKISVGGGSVKGVVQLQQKFLTDAFRARKQAAAPKSIYRKARNGEVYKVLEDHSNNRKPPEAQGKPSGACHSKISNGESIQDAVLLIDSDDGDDDGDEIHEISIHEFQQSNLFGASRATRRKEKVCSLSDFR